MRLNLAPLLSTAGILAQAVPNQVGNIDHAMPKKVGNFAYIVPKYVGNCTQPVPSSVGNGDGPSNVCSKNCRCAVLMTILFGGIVLAIMALQTPKVKSAETKKEIPEECPPSTTPVIVYRIQKKSIKPRIDSKKKKRAHPEGPSGDDQIPLTGEDQQTSSEDTTQPDLRSSESSCGRLRSNQERTATQEKSVCECLKKPPTPSAGEPANNAHKKEQGHSCIKPQKRKIKTRRKPQSASAGRPSETKSITRSRSRRDTTIRFRTYDNHQQFRDSPSTSSTSSRSRPRVRRKAKI